MLQSITCAQRKAHPKNSPFWFFLEIFFVVIQKVIHNKIWWTALKTATSKSQSTSSTGNGSFSRQILKITIRNKKK